MSKLKPHQIIQALEQGLMVEYGFSCNDTWEVIEKHNITCEMLFSPNFKWRVVDFEQLNEVKVGVGSLKLNLQELNRLMVGETIYLSCVYNRDVNGYYEVTRTANSKLQIKLGDINRFEIIDKNTGKMKLGKDWFPVDVYHTKQDYEFDSACICFIHKVENACKCLNSKQTEVLAKNSILDKSKNLTLDTAKEINDLLGLGYQVPVHKKRSLEN